MAPWMNWAGLAALLVILELMSGTFYLLMIALGLACGAIAALVGTSSATQFIVAAVVGAAATGLLHRSRASTGYRGNSERDPGMNMDIGESIMVNHWTQHLHAAATARVQYRGALWDVEHAGSGAPEAGTFEIVGMRGSCLLVQASQDSIS